MFSYLIMARSIVVREVCKDFNLCSSSLPDAPSVTICMASDVASNSTCRSVLHLLQFPREVAALVCFVSTCLWFFLRTLVTTSSNRSSQAVLGLRFPRWCRDLTRDPEEAGSLLRAISSRWHNTATHRVLAR